MRWKDSATGPASAVQMLTIPVASCSVVGRLENGFDPVELGGRRAAGPDGAVAEGLDFLEAAQGTPAADHGGRTRRTCRDWVSVMSSSNPRRGGGYSAVAGSSHRCRQFGRGRHQWQQDDELGVSRASDCTRRSPWCFSTTIRRARSRPRPVPSPNGLVVKNGVKIRSDDVRGNAGTVVADLDANHLVVLAHRAQRQRAVSVHRLNGVVDDVGPYLVEIAWVAKQFGQRVVACP